MIELKCECQLSIFLSFVTSLQSSRFDPSIPPIRFTISNISSSVLLTWLIYVPCGITLVSIAFCIVYRYNFSRPLLGGDGAPVHSGAWDRPLDTSSASGVRSDINNGNSRLEGGYKPTEGSWGYQQPRSTPYAVQLSGRLQRIDPRTGQIK